MFLVSLVELMFSVAGCAQFYTVRSSGLLYAVTCLDSSIVRQVVEEKERLTDVEKMCREKLLNKLQNAVGEDNIATEV